MASYSPSNSKERRSGQKHGEYPRNIDICAREKHYRKRDVFEGEKVHGSGKTVERSSNETSKPSDRPPSAFQKNSGALTSWLFEEKYMTIGISSGLDSLCQTSKTKHTRPDCKVLTEDPVGRYKLHSDSKSSLDDSVSFGFGWSSSYCQPFSDVNSHCSPVILNFGSGSSNPLSAIPSEMVGCLPAHSSHATASHGDLVFHDLLVQRSIGINRNEPRNHELEGKNSCIENDQLSSRKGKSINNSNSKDRYGDLREGKEEASESIYILKTGSEHSEEAFFSEKNPDQFDCSNNEECHHHSQIAHPGQNGSKEMEETRSVEKRLASEGQTSVAVPFYQVVMLESCILRLAACEQGIKQRI